MQEDNKNNLSAVVPHFSQKVRGEGGSNIYLIFFLVFTTAFFILPKICASEKNSLYKYAYVTKIIDGDTIEVKKHQQIRYIGIDTPELNQPFGQAAKKYNSQLVLHKFIRIEFDKNRQDYLNRELAYVFIDGIFVNQALIKKGLAKTLTILPNAKYYQQLTQAQKNARHKKIGLWPSFNQITWLPTPTLITPNYGGLK